VLIAKLLSYFLLLVISTTLIAADWKDVPKGKKRLKSAEFLNPVKTESDPEAIKPVEVAPDDSSKEQRQKELDLKDGLYTSGMGEISGAFGIDFGEALPKSVIVKDLGWKEISNLPNSLSYIVDKVLDIPTFHIKPPAIPRLLANKNIAYRAFLGFENQPLWLQAKSIPNIKEVIAVLKRKYGEPNSESNQQLVFKREGKVLYFSHKRNRGTLDYYDLVSFQDYLDRRKVSLRSKYKEPERLRLSQTEKNIFTVADQLEISRKLSGSIFGVDFDKRVGFLAKPDEYVTLAGAIPFKEFAGGTYKIMVSPDLMPIMLQYETNVSLSQIGKQKAIFDQALELVYGGFLKKTSKHTVITFRGISISVLIRSGKLSFTVLNNTENKLHNARVKTRRITEREAEAARLKALADIRQKKLDEIARLKREKELAIERQKRKTEIKDETGF